MLKPVYGISMFDVFNLFQRITNKFIDLFIYLNENLTSFMKKFINQYIK